VVAVEYFSKWVEAKPLLSITSATIQKFFWQNIVCRFGVPHEVTMDNGKQFDSTDFKEFCTYLGTEGWLKWMDSILFLICCSLIHFNYFRHYHA
jgi:hypothetical protein